MINTKCQQNIFLVTFQKEKRPSCLFFFQIVATTKKLQLTLNVQQECNNKGDSGTTIVAPKFSDTLTVFQPSQKLHQKFHEYICLVFGFQFYSMKRTNMKNILTFSITGDLGLGCLRQIVKDRHRDYDKRQFPEVLRSRQIKLCFLTRSLNSFLDFFDPHELFADCIIPLNRFFFTTLWYYYRFCSETT